MTVTLAESAGFCFGVKSAVALAEEAAQKYDDAVMLGAIIHNQSVIDKLTALGLGIVTDVSQVKEGQAVVIRSHGEGRSVHENLLQKKAIIVDATCPKVSQIHKIVKEKNREGKKIVIVGVADHPEVVAISGWCNDYILIESPQKMEEFIKMHKETDNSPLVFVSQTTLSKKIWIECIEIVKKQWTNGEFFDTICRATYIRQEEACAIARNCDAMVVVGDKESANARHLAQLCEEICDKTFFIANPENLPKLSAQYKVGITAGASTPQWIIKEVCNKMSEEIMEIEESFAEMLEKSIKTLNTGDKVTGVVTSITPNEIHVDLGTKHAGFIPVSELSDDPSMKVEDMVKVGEEIETFVVRVNDQEGVITLSKKRLDVVKGWEKIEAVQESGEPVEGIVTEENRGGVVVFVMGVRVFVPASQTGLPREAAMSELLKQKVTLVITEVNRSRRRVVGSISRVSRAARAEAAQKVWDEIAEGKHYTGEVKSLTSYGAFVDIGGVDGMVHISELSWKRVKHPSEVVSVGDSVEVFVLSADMEKRKISLGMKDHSQDPWANFVEKYAIGDTADVRVVKLMTFGAFAEVVPGVDGLIHISQMATHRVEKPSDIVKEGETVSVQITDIDTDRKKVSLSMSALMMDDSDYQDD
ncbi:MAG: bifunctional 4-hydroxy-3-methylbut-2-enyl diphosphate reductase/30S ribosomal protein S1 [Eubacteriales bacterium]